MNNKFLIDTPPPTISGSLHIGHIFSYTQADIIARYQMYKGYELIYPFCFDNNGIPTAKLASKNKIIRENIIDFSITKGQEYKNSFLNSGIEFSNNSYHTYDNSAINIAYKAFDKLKDKGIIYKSECEYLYCTTTKTSISQSELDDDGKIERTGLLPEIKRGIGWFIDIKNHITSIKEMGNKIDWIPFKYKKRFDDWCDNIKYDWSISRERNFGIPIPNEESMTFDTWFISSLSPQLAYNSYSKEEGLEIPIFDMRYQSHDIIRTWAFYTIAMSYFLNEQIPWSKIIITGHALDGKGNKFSKSSGNATPPEPIIKQFGINGIRYWASSSTMGTDLKLDPNRFKMGYRILNKLKNAKIFLGEENNGESNDLLNEWYQEKNMILSYLDNYELDKALDSLYKYFWNKYCDIHIEYCKKDPIYSTLKTIMIDMEPIFYIFFK